MHDLQLVGVHEDGEHLLLTDAEDGRYLLRVDEALRAAVRRDRAHLGQLQIEIGGGLRPREVQARIRAGATAEEVAGASGWPLEKVRRYEGPVLAERAHIAQLAREVVLRRRAGESPRLGPEVSRRLADRGVDLDHVEWDSFRSDGAPWTVTVSFTAGGRDRQARWHLDLAGRSVTPADDEARWLSEQVPESDGPLGGARLSAVPTGSVYDVEADGGVHDLATRRGQEDPLDLMTAMRSRRRERDLHRVSPRRSGEPVGPTDVPGALHPARRRRTGRPEPLELDPTLLAEPPAAHPPASRLPEGLMDLPADLPNELVDELPEELLESLTAPGEPTPEPEIEPAQVHAARRWPLAAPVLEASLEQDEDAESEPDDVAGPTGSGADDAATHARATVTATAAEDTDEVVLPLEVDTGAQPAPEVGDRPAESPRHRAQPRPRARRASVPSWDDIMFGAKRD